MKVKQLIYTSWKNGSSTRKGFMVYSKSVGISPEDENAITASMRYTTLPSLPYTPTWDEIENLFPRNNSYFRLPSGKYCFAQSSYLGTDYSGRTGNYIIHAFVFDNPPVFNQFNIIRSDVFRRSMTQEELDAESNPPALPEIEVSFPDNPGDVAMLQRFFTPDKKDKLRYLVEAVLQGVSQKKTVYLFDEQPNLACWYKALSYCLPKMTLSQVTFSTYSCYVPNDIAIACVKEGTLFNYDMNLAMGNLVYNFKTGKINDKITISAYTDSIVDEFYKNPAGAAIFASAIENYMAEAHGDLMLAIKLSKFYSAALNEFYAGAFNDFSTPQALGEVFGCVTTSGRLPADKLAAIIGKLITSNPAFSVTANADMYKYVMAHGAEDIRFEIIRLYTDSRLAASVPVNSYESEYQSVKSGAPFAWKDFLAYINKAVGKERFIGTRGVTSFAAYVLVSTVMDCGTTSEINDKLIPDYTRSIANEPDLTLFSCFYNKLKSCGMADQVIRDITQGYVIFKNNNYRHTFDLLDAIKVPELTANTCAFMINNFGYDGNFRAIAEKYLASDAKLYADMEVISRTDGNVKAFLDNMVSARFLANVPTDADLDNFYKTYFARNAEMKDVFYKGLTKRINSLSLYVERAKIAIKWFEVISSADPSQRAVILQIASNVIFDRRINYIEFVTLYREKPQAVEKILTECRNAGIDLKGNYYDAAKLAEQICTASKLKGKNYKNNAFVPYVLKNGILTGFADAQFIGKTIAESHLEDIFALYETVLNNENITATANKDFIRNILSPLVEAVNVRQDDDFREKFVARLGKLKGETYLWCMSGLIGYAVDPVNARCGISILLDEYFDGMPRKKIEKFYSEIKQANNVIISTEVKRYIEEKIKTSKNLSFMERLFNKAPNLGDDDDNNNGKGGQNGQGAQGGQKAPKKPKK